MKLARPNPKLAAKRVIDIVRATPFRGYKLKIEFSDGIVRTIDFRPFLESSQNPQIREFLDPQRFSQFRIQDGDLMWGDYELCFPIADLYEGRV
jgi:hypothetical protein